MTLHGVVSPEPRTFGSEASKGSETELEGASTGVPRPSETDLGVRGQKDAQAVGERQRPVFAPVQH